MFSNRDLRMMGKTQTYSNEVVWNVKHDPQQEANADLPAPFFQAAEAKNEIESLMSGLEMPRKLL